MSSRKLPTGVMRVKSTGKFRARIVHPKKKARVWLGTFDTIEEATTAIRNKREQFEMKFVCKQKKQSSHDHIDIDPCQNQVARKRVKLEKVFESENGEKSNNHVLDYDEEKPECGFDHGSPTSTFEAEKIRDEILGNPEKPECGFDHGSPTSTFEVAENLSELTMSAHYSGAGNIEAIDNPEKPDWGFNDIGFSTSVFRPENLSDLTISSCKSEGSDSATNAKTMQKPFCLSTDFEEWVRLGIINEYGQLLGEYSKLDDGLWFSDHYDNEGITGFGHLCFLCSHSSEVI